MMMRRDSGLSQFVPNDTRLGNGGASTCLLTGPNMGKPLVLLPAVLIHCANSDYPLTQLLSQPHTIPSEHTLDRPRLGTIESN